MQMFGPFQPTKDGQIPKTCKPKDVYNAGIGTRATGEKALVFNLKTILGIRRIMFVFPEDQWEDFKGLVNGAGAKEEGE
jgi:hypothetical protein